MLSNFNWFYRKKAWLIRGFKPMHLRWICQCSDTSADTTIVTLSLERFSKPQISHVHLYAWLSLQWEWSTVLKMIVLAAILPYLTIWQYLCVKDYYNNFSENKSSDSGQFPTPGRAALIFIGLDHVAFPMALMYLGPFFVNWLIVGLINMLNLQHQ